MPPLNEFNEYLKEIWDSRWLTNMGNQHKKLEKALADYLKVPYLSLFNNGTIALMVAIKALGLKGEVITTPFTFPATVNALIWCNIKPVFCDIDNETMNIDISKAQSLISDNTSGILPVHVFGTPCDVDSIERFAVKNNLKVIYDAAHAFGENIEGNGIGNYGDISMFSFHATKVYNTAEGGALTCQTKEMKEQIDLLKNFGIKKNQIKLCKMLMEQKKVRLLKLIKENLTKNLQSHLI